MYKQYLDKGGYQGFYLGPNTDNSVHTWNKIYVVFQFILCRYLHIIAMTIANPTMLILYAWYVCVYLCYYVYVWIHVFMWMYMSICVFVCMMCV